MNRNLTFEWRIKLPTIDVAYVCLCLGLRAETAMIMMRNKILMWKIIVLASTTATATEIYRNAMHHTRQKTAMRMVGKPHRRVKVVSRIRLEQPSTMAMNYDCIGRGGIRMLLSISTW